MKSEALVALPLIFLFILVVGPFFFPYSERDVRLECDVILAVGLEELTARVDRLENLQCPHCGQDINQEVSDEAK